MTERNRTTKCGAITSDMLCQAILGEHRKLNDDNDDVMSPKLKERLLVSGALFAENDHKIISTFPPDLDDREFKRRLYSGRYSGELPEDFFKNEDK